jgi:murein DD-endopeptidase MepM/ murein hydrolase activator NlpD
MRWTLRVALLVLCASFAVSRSPLAAVRRAVAHATPNGQQPTVNGIIIPVTGVTASQLKPTFNQARVGHVHHALDILAPRGTPVVAAVDGTIRKLFISGAGGITIYEFDRDAALVYYYAHLDHYADGVHEGMAVRQGDVIGYVGTTGNAPASTPHLHFAIGRLGAEKKWWDSEAIDPYPILTAPAATPRPSLAAR